MTIIICFTIILLCILSSISIEDINTMLISETKLISLMISGLLYLLYLGLSNEKIDIKDLIINNSLSMVIIFTIMYSISYLSFKIFGINSLGMGDIKLSSISTIWLGIELSFLSLCISFFYQQYIVCTENLLKDFYHFNSIHLHHFYQWGYFVLGL